MYHLAAAAAAAVASAAAQSQGGSRGIPPGTHSYAEEGISAQGILDIKHACYFSGGVGDFLQP